MIILEKSDCITFYSVNTKYFDKFSEVTCGGDGGSYWRTAETNTYTFRYNLNFHAKDERSDEPFIEYKSRMVCIVKIENEKQDALQMLTLIREFHALRDLFIKNNSLSHFSKLNLQEYQITQQGLIRMEASIARLKEMKPHEDKSELEKKIERDIESMEFDVRIIKDRINI